MNVRSVSFGTGMETYLWATKTEHKPYKYQGRKFFFCKNVAKGGTRDGNPGMNLTTSSLFPFRDAISCTGEMAVFRYRFPVVYVNSRSESDSRR